jgi:hypothetical protein
MNKTVLKIKTLRSRRSSKSASDDLLSIETSIRRVEELHLMSSSKKDSHIRPLEPSGRAQALTPATPLQSARPIERLRAVQPAQAVEVTQGAHAVEESAEERALKGALASRDNASRAALSELISAVDRGELQGDEAWDKALQITLETSLGLPPSLASSMLPALKALAESDQGELSALKERLTRRP